MFDICKLGVTLYTVKQFEQKAGFLVFIWYSNVKWRPQKKTKNPEEGGGGQNHQRVESRPIFLIGKNIYLFMPLF